MAEEKFSEKYAHLVPDKGEVPVRRLGDYPNGPTIPERYRKPWDNPPDGFAKLFCEEYGDEKKDASQDE